MASSEIREEETIEEINKRNEERQKRFLEYFNNTFYIEKNDILNRDIDREPNLEYDFGPEMYTSAKDVFSTIKTVYEKGENIEQLEVFLRRMDLLAREKVDTQHQKANTPYGSPQMTEAEAGSSQGSMTVIDGKYVKSKVFEGEGEHGLRTDFLDEIASLSRGELGKIDFKNIANMLNTMVPEEVYTILNANDDEYNRYRYERFKEYLGMKDKYDKMMDDQAQLEIAGLQKYYRNGILVLNEKFVDEFTNDILRYGFKETIKAYIAPMRILPKYFLFGEFSPFGTATNLYKSIKDHNIKKGLGNRLHYRFNYESFMNLARKGFYENSLGSFSELALNRKNFKVDSIEAFSEVLNITSQDYLNEYNKILPLLRKYHFHRQTVTQLKERLQNINVIYGEIERQLGMKLSDASKTQLRNKLILNRITDKYIKENPALMVDDPSSPIFGFNIPLRDGKFDAKLFEKMFSFMSEKDYDLLWNESVKFMGKQTRVLKQIFMPNEFKDFGVESAEEELRKEIVDFLKNEVEFSMPEDEIEAMLSEYSILELEKKSGNFEEGEIFGHKVAYKTKIDAIIGNILQANLNYNYYWDDAQKYIDFLFKNIDFIKNQNREYDPVLQRMASEIQISEDFILSEGDSKLLEEKLPVISKGFRNGETVEAIMQKAFPLPDGDNVKDMLEDRKHMESILKFFQGQLDYINDDFKNYYSNAAEEAGRKQETSEKNTDSRYKEQYDEAAEALKFESEKNPEHNLKEERYYGAKEAEEAAQRMISILEKSANEIDEENKTNSEVFDRNFENIINGVPAINLMLTKNYDSNDFRNMIQFTDENVIKQYSNMEKIYSQIQDKKTSYLAFKELSQEMTFGEEYNKFLNMADPFFPDISFNKELGSYEMAFYDYATNKDIGRFTFKLSRDIDDETKTFLEESFARFGKMNIDEKKKLFEEILRGPEILQALAQNTINKIKAQQVNEVMNTPLTKKSEMLFKELLKENPNIAKKWTADDRRNINKFSEKLFNEYLAPEKTFNQAGKIADEIKKENIASKEKSSDETKNKEFKEAKAEVKDSKEFSGQGDKKDANETFNNKKFDGNDSKEKDVLKKKDENYNDYKFSNKEIMDFFSKAKEEINLPKEFIDSFKENSYSISNARDAIKMQIEHGEKIKGEKITGNEFQINRWKENSKLTEEQRKELNSAILAISNLRDVTGDDVPIDVIEEIRETLAELKEDELAERIKENTDDEEIVSRVVQAYKELQSGLEKKIEQIEDTEKLNTQKAAEKQAKKEEEEKKQDEEERDDTIDEQAEKKSIIEKAKEVVSVIKPAGGRRR